MSKAAKKVLPATKDVENKIAFHLGKHPLHELRHEVDSLFDNFFSNFSLGSFGRGHDLLDPIRKAAPARDLMPSMDVTETDKEFRASAEMPGMDEGDIDLAITDHQLIIKGEKKEETKSNEEGHRLMERHYGSIYRSVALPDGVDEDSVDATYEKGVLTVTMKKAKSKKKAAKSIKIKSKK